MPHGYAKCCANAIELHGLIVNGIFKFDGPMKIRQTADSNLNHYNKSHLPCVVPWAISMFYCWCIKIQISIPCTINNVFNKVTCDTFTSCNSCI